MQKTAKIAWISSKHRQKTGGLRKEVFRGRKFFGLPDPDLLVRGSDPDPSFIKQNSKKDRDFCSFVTSS
jgi:hypothetical protein